MDTSLIGKTATPSPKKKKTKFEIFKLADTWYGWNKRIAEIKHLVHGEDHQDPDIHRLNIELEDLIRKITILQESVMIGTRVIRLDGGYTAGRIGIVLEFDHANERARVLWIGRINDLIKKEAIKYEWSDENWIRTWCSFRTIKPYSEEI